MARTPSTSKRPSQAQQQTEPPLRLEWWEPDGVGWYGLYGDRAYAEVVDEFELVRNDVVCYLAGLPDEGWARRARHATFGELAVAGLCEEILAHDHEHLAQLMAR